MKTLQTGLSANGTAKVIELLDRVTLDINSAECVYIDEDTTDHQLHEELTKLWVMAYDIKTKFKSAFAQ